MTEFQGLIYQDGDLIDSYCVKCKDKRTMIDSIIQISDSGRRLAKGKCEVCKDKVYRVLGKATGDY